MSSRCSFIIFPVLLDTYESNPVLAIREFLTKWMRIVESDVTNLLINFYRRFLTRKNRKASANEISILVQMSTPEEREFVATFVSNLDKDSSFDFKVPNHLKSDFQALEKLAFMYRRKIHKSRTSIRFDDLALSFQLLVFNKNEIFFFSPHEARKK